MEEGGDILRQALKRVRGALWQVHVASHPELMVTPHSADVFRMRIKCDENRAILESLHPR